MGKYVYIRFVKLTKERDALGKEFFQNTWWPKHDEICKKHDVKILKRGAVYGVPYNMAFIYETDKPLDEYVEFTHDLDKIHKVRIIGLSETITVF